MRNVKMTICLMVMLLISPASANVLMFDDIPDPTEGEWPMHIPKGYGGFNWDNFWVICPTLEAPGSGYDLGCVSRSYVAFNGLANPAVLSDGVFTFNGAYLTSAWDPTLNIEVQGYLGGSLLYDTTVTVPNTGPTWCNFDYVGVDELRFSSVGGNQFAMDNFTYTPEPATLFLLGLGAVMLRRKR